MQVAFYGGSFNPPHVAHVLAAAYLRSVGGFDRVLFVPVFSHAFDKQLADYEHRVRMCELAVGWLPGVEVSRVEERVVPVVPTTRIRALAARHDAAARRELEVYVPQKVLSHLRQHALYR
jgi:nicotinate-nucleotide adenylyltransferase